MRRKKAGLAGIIQSTANQRIVEASRAESQK
jgi:hypothetical protein